MAAAHLSLTRRALLAGACSAPALSAMDSPVAASASPFVPSEVEGRPASDRHGESFVVTKWDRALALLQKAQAGLAAVAHTEDDDLYDRALGRWNAALKALLRAPAPDHAALARKPVLSEVEGLDLLVAHQFWEITGAERCLAAIQHDARRFAASAA